MGTSNIADKVVVITGASSGIGESTARLLGRSGAKLVLGARRKDRIDALVKECLWHFPLSGHYRRGRQRCRFQD